MKHLENELREAVDRWDGWGWPRPSAMVVAGSGLTTDFLQPLAEARSWSELIPFPIHGIEGHPLQVQPLDAGEGHSVLYSRGRLHVYQGFTAAEACFSVRLGALLGAKVLVLTNSAGGLDPQLGTGDLVMIEDHLNLTGLNPLWGEPPSSWGPRFPDMAKAYDPALRELLQEHAQTESIELRRGIYAGLGGPSYETPAEVRMLRQQGAHVVGMSTVLEVIAAHHMGVRCAGISLVSNPAAGVTDEVLDHEDVLVQGRVAGSKLQRLLASLLRDPRCYAEQP